MKKLLSTLLVTTLLSTTPGILIAEDNIQLSDDYFEIKSSEDNSSLFKPKNENVLSIEPSPNWNLQRDREYELIEESSVNENSFDGIITQGGIELANNTPDVMRSGNQSTLYPNSNSGSLSSPSANANEAQKQAEPLPKTLKVRPESQPEDEDPIVESSLGDWVFDFPK
jgi:hypothetical protein